MKSDEPIYIQKGIEKTYVTQQEFDRIINILKVRYVDVFKRFKEFKKRCEDDKDKKGGVVY